MLRPPPRLAAFLQACTNSSGGILLKNVSPLLLQVQPTGSTSLTNPVRASDELRDAVSAQLAADGSSVAVILVPAGGYVVAYSDGAPASVNVGISVPDASQAYATDVIARYIESKAPRPRRLTNSAAECAKEASDLWSQTPPDGNVDLDRLLAETALGPALSCRKLVKEVSEELNQEPPTNERVLAQEFKVLKKDVKASFFDDLAKLARNLVKVAPRNI